LCSDGNLISRLSTMLRYIGQANVSDLVLALITLSPLSRANPLGTTGLRLRKEYYDQLNRGNILQKLVDIIVAPEQHIAPSAPLSSEHFSSASTQLFNDLVEKLSLEETAEQLLQALGNSSHILYQLINAALDNKQSDLVQNSCLKILAFLIKLSADPEVVVFASGPSGVLIAPTSVPSVLHPLHNRIINFIEVQITSIIGTLIEYDEEKEGTALHSTEAVKHPGYSVKVPFSWRRILLLEVVVRLVESKASAIAFFTPEFLKILMAWIVEYPHNNMLQNLVYRIVFVILKYVQ
jgi:hypothetical protein